jgi:hypothetical protein
VNKVALSQEDKTEIEIIVNERIAVMMVGLLDEFERFVNEVPARELLEAIKTRSEKEAVRLKARS